MSELEPMYPYDIDPHFVLIALEAVFMVGNETPEHVEMYEQLLKEAYPDKIK